MIRSAFLVALVLLPPLTLAAQVPHFTARVDLVAVDVLVTDGDRRPVPGLTAADFELRDNGVSQRISHIAMSNMPLDVWLVFDTTHSLDGEGLRHLVEAGQTLVRELRSDDRVALVTFDEQPILRSALTLERARVLEVLGRLRAHGSTAWRDALYATIALHEPAPSRRLLLLFSDGSDNMSWITEMQLRRVVAAADIVIYAVAPYSRAKVPGICKDVTAQTGGELLRIGATHELTMVFRRVLERMKARYMLSYYPEGVPSTGWHRIDVRLKGRRGSIQARRGYFAGPSS